MNLGTVAAQLPALQPGELERWLAAAATVAALVMLGTRLFSRDQRTEHSNGSSSKNSFQLFKHDIEQELQLLRERIDDRHYTVVHALEGMRVGLLTDNEKRSDKLHRRLTNLETVVARLDERTRKS